MGTCHALEWPPLPRRRPAVAAAEAQSVAQPKAWGTGLLRPRPRPVVRPAVRPATGLVGEAVVGWV